MLRQENWDFKTSLGNLMRICFRNQLDWEYYIVVKYLPSKTKTPGLYSSVCSRVGGWGHLRNWDYFKVKEWTHPFVASLPSNSNPQLLQRCWSHIGAVTWVSHLSVVPSNLSKGLIVLSRKTLDAIFQKIRGCFWTLWLPALEESLCDAWRV